MQVWNESENSGENLYGWLLDYDSFGQVNQSAHGSGIGFRFEFERSDCTEEVDLLSLVQITPNRRSYQLSLHKKSYLMYESPIIDNGTTYCRRKIEIV